METRNPLVTTLLSVFVPFYILWWFYVTAEGMKKKGADAPRLILFFGPIIGLVVVMFLTMTVRMSGPSNTAILNIITMLAGVVLVIAAIVGPLVYFYKFSAAAEKVTGGKITAGLGFILFLFISPVAVYLIQDALNQTGQLPTSNAPVAPTADALTPPSAPPEPPANPIS